MSPSSSFVLLSSILLLLFLAYSPTALTSVHAAAGEVGYFVLIDAGSTGSRAHVHQYVKDPTKKLPVVDESTNKKIKPGLSYYAEKDPPAVRKSIKELLDFIKETVPQKYWAQTPIHVQATAGLRSVTPTEANTVLEIVRDDLETSGFLFQRTWARIISGEQEGINGWMAVNYLLGVFDQSTDSDGQPPQSTGVVEMGGSSMQITFAPSAPTKEDKKQLKEIDIAGHKYFLYTHSFLQYGLQAAEKLYQRLAINDIEDGGNPCYPRAFRHSSVGDFDRCTQLLTKVVDKSVECSSTCSFNGVYQPKIANEPFFAIENFYYTAKFFGTDQEQNQVALPNPEERAPASGNPVTNGLRAKGKEFCNRDWPSLLESYKGKTPTEELSYFCFSAAYQSVVLESGLGFHPRSNLRVAKMINGKGIDWEMGATILELIGSGPSAHDGVEDPASRARIGNTIGSTVDFDTSLALPSSQNRLRSNASQGGICKSCLLYTILFALVVVLAYFTYQRWMKRQSGPMTSYSQAAFNRV